MVHGRELKRGKLPHKLQPVISQIEGESTISRGQNEKTKTDRRMVYTEP